MRVETDPRSAERLRTPWPCSGISSHGDRLASPASRSDSCEISHPIPVCRGRLECVGACRSMHRVRVRIGKALASVSGRFHVYACMDGLGKYFRNFSQAFLAVSTYTPTPISERIVPTARRPDISLQALERVEQLADIRTKRSDRAVTPAVMEPAFPITSLVRIPAVTPEPPAIVNIKSNLRAGPGTHYGIAGVLPQGLTVNPTATYAAWLQVDGRWWIRAAWGDNVPRGLPQVKSIPPTPPPADPSADPYRVATVEKFRQQVRVSCEIEADRLIIHNVPAFSGLEIGIRLGFHNHNPNIKRWHHYHSGNFSAAPGDYRESPAIPAITGTISERTRTSTTLPMNTTVSPCGWTTYGIARWRAIKKRRLSMPGKYVQPRQSRLDARMKASLERRKASL